MRGGVTAIPSAPDPASFIDDPMVLRRFACPGCLTQIATEIARAGDPVAPRDAAGAAVMNAARHRQQDARDILDARLASNTAAAERAARVHIGRSIPAPEADRAD